MGQRTGASRRGWSAAGAAALCSVHDPTRPRRLRPRARPRAAAARDRHDIAAAARHDRGGARLGLFLLERRGRMDARGAGQLVVYWVVLRLALVDVYLVLLVGC